MGELMIRRELLLVDVYVVQLCEHSEYEKVQ